MIIKQEGKLKQYENGKEMSEVVSLVAMVKESIPSHLLRFTMNPLSIPYIHSTYHTSIQQFICPFRCHLT